MKQQRTKIILALAFTLMAQKIAFSRTKSKL